MRLYVLLSRLIVIYSMVYRSALFQYFMETADGVRMGFTPSQRFNPLYGNARGARPITVRGCRAYFYSYFSLIISYHE